MTKNKKVSSVLIVCMVGIICAGSGLAYGIVKKYWKIEREDLKIVKTNLINDPFIKTYQSRNSKATVLVLSIDKFHAHDLKTPKEYFDEGDLLYIMSNMKSGDKIEIGILKSDYELLKRKTKPWGILQGFSNSKRLNMLPIYDLNHKGNNLLQLENINNKMGKSGFSIILGSGFFLFVFIYGYSEVRKLK